ncbi:hypothetical protein [Aquabacterium sp.]|uniref:hypothetical protein n=1 Tax=Aquabacterium sp. TaxID=1872578 RepID=UPI002C279D75|nr:hypothetical protein [Aquabacterium sp.]HSW04745.1 hypothetical protein [Aquabacterium sp.]
MSGPTSSATGMPIDGLLVLQRSDVAHIAAQRERFAGLPLLCIDPGIMDSVIQAGLGEYQLRRLNVPRDMPARVYTETTARVTLIDLLLTNERERLFGPGLFQGWDRNALYLSLHVMLTALALRPLVEADFPEQRLGLLRPDNPVLFNFDSMAPVEVFAANARRWSIVDRYEAGRFWNPLLLQACFDFDGIAQAAAEGRAEALTHLATCFYDVKAFGEAVAARFTHNIDLPSVYCDVPVRRPRMLLKMLADTDPQWIDPRCALYRERARQVLLQQLADLIPARAALELQADTLAQRAYLQAVSYFGLLRALKGRQPHVVVADHDNGYLGPLFSLADTLGSEITVLPHSGYTNSALPHGRRVTAIERVGFGTHVLTMLGQPVATRSVRYRNPPQPHQQPQPRQQLKRLCILVNTMFADGHYRIDLFGLMTLFKGLRARAVAHDLELSVRLKPSTPALNVVAGALGEPAAYFMRCTQLPIEQVAQECDLCLAHGELTTGTINFLDTGSLVLHVSDEDWPTQLAPQAPFLHDRLVQSFHTDALLALVDRLLAEPAEYLRLQQAQAAAYAHRLAGGHDTFFPASSDSRSLVPC